MSNIWPVSLNVTISAYKIYSQSDVYNVDEKYVSLHCVFQLAKCIKDLTEMLNKKSQELNDFTEKLSVYPVF